MVKSWFLKNEKKKKGSISYLIIKVDSVHGEGDDQTASVVIYLLNYINSFVIWLLLSYNFNSSWHNNHKHIKDHDNHLIFSLLLSFFSSYLNWGWHLDHVSSRKRN